MEWFRFVRRVKLLSGLSTNSAPRGQLLDRSLRRADDRQTCRVQDGRHPRRVHTACALICAMVAITTTTSMAAASPSPPKSPIQHVVVIVQENHTFDNYFAAY